VASSSQDRSDSNGFGIKIFSRLLTLRIMEDDETDGPLAYRFAVRDPVVEVYNSTVPDVFRQYIGLLASDISLYESPTQDSSPRAPQSCKGARVQENFSRVPFLHRTSLEQSWISSNFQRSKHRVLSVRFLSTEELQSDSCGSHKSSVIHVSLRDMTYRFHAAPLWFSRIPKFFTLAESSEPTAAAAESPQRSSPFGQTHLHISIQKFLVDFCQPDLPNSSQSRLILNLGLLTVNSTLISNTPRVGIKIKVSDVSLRVSNKLLQNPNLEQSPLGPNGVYEEEIEETVVERNLDLDTFLDVHGLVIMSTLDHLECRIDLNSDQRNKHFADQPRAPVVAVEATAGLCCLYGCADSLLVLTVREPPPLPLLPPHAGTGHVRLPQRGPGHQKRRLSFRGDRGAPPELVR
jgi:hypothetical protein